MPKREQENERRISANRRNSQKSTGPKTPEGKAVVSQNARKHGLLSRETFLPDEDGNALDAFSRNLHADLLPVGELENLLVERIVSSAWRLRRVLRVERELFSREALNVWGANKMDLGLAFTQEGNGADAFSKLSRYETSIERSLFRALHELQRLQALRAGQQVPPPMAVDMDMNVSLGAD
jgi:hypothetical protein